MMRRQILPAFREDKASYSSSTAATADGYQHLDVATGTGRFASFLWDNHPELLLTLLDLSPHYLDAARTTMERVARQHKQQNIASNFIYVESAVESMPFPDNSFDSLTCVYLFLELPHEIRVQAAKEMARVLKPGGRLFFVDSIQETDTSYRSVLQGFAGNFHEPYYLDYVQQDLRAVFESAGMVVESEDIHWLSKSVVVLKPSFAHGDGSKVCEI